MIDIALRRLPNEYVSSSRPGRFKHNSDTRTYLFVFIETTSNGTVYTYTSFANVFDPLRLFFSRPRGGFRSSSVKSTVPPREVYIYKERDSANERTNIRRILLYLNFTTGFSSNEGTPCEQRVLQTRKINAANTFVDS